jgi:PTS system beta-glucosides-specific IIC component
MGQVGAVLGIFLRTRDARQKMLAGSAATAGIFGITEPAVYGLTLPLRRPFILAAFPGLSAGRLLALATVTSTRLVLPMSLLWRR